MKLGEKIVNNDSKAYIIAEIGVNHEGSLEKAMLMIRQASIGGADAVKFQTYKADLIASPDSPSYWSLNHESTDSQYKLFQKFDSFGESDYKILKDYCDELEIEFLSTPFDLEAVDYLDKLVPFYKISSSDITNIPLLKKIASKKKSILISTGASTDEEIQIALSYLYKYGAPEISLLHCVLNYPTEDNLSNLNRINKLSQSFPNELIGYSDHTLPGTSCPALIYAYSIGAVILEKHFTYDKTLKGNDHYHAFDQADLATLRGNLDRIHQMKTSNSSDFANELVARKNARRGIYAKAKIEHGWKLSEDMIITLRPISGISAIEWDNVIGKVAKKTIFPGEPITFDNVQFND